MKENKGIVQSLFSKDHLFWMVINVLSGNYFLLMDYGSGINLGKLHANLS